MMSFQYYCGKVFWKLKFHTSVSLTFRLHSLIRPITITQVAKHSVESIHLCLELIKDQRGKDRD